MRVITPSAVQQETGFSPHHGNLQQVSRPQTGQSHRTGYSKLISLSADRHSTVLLPKADKEH